MEKYINKSILILAIEKRIKELQDLFKEDEKKLDSFQKTAINLCIDECKVVLKILDALEVKEINNVWYDIRRTIPEDGNKQIICIKEDGLAVSTVGKIVNGTVKWAYLDNLLNISNVETKEVDLEKEIQDSIYNHFFDLEGIAIAGSSAYATVEDMVYVAKHFYELGLKHRN